MQRMLCGVSGNVCSPCRWGCHDNSQPPPCDWIERDHDNDVWRRDSFRADVRIPPAMDDYNQLMSGVDLFDQPHGIIPKRNLFYSKCSPQECDECSILRDNWSCSNIINNLQGEFLALQGRERLSQHIFRDVATFRSPLCSLANRSPEITATGSSRGS